MSKEALRQMMNHPNGGLVGRSISETRPLSPEVKKRLDEFESDVEGRLEERAYQGDPRLRTTVAPAYKTSHSAEDAWFPASRWQRFKARLRRG